MKQKNKKKFLKNLLGNALGDANGEGNLGLDGVHDGGGGEGWWDVDDGGVGLGGVGGLLDGVEHGKSEMLLAPFWASHHRPHWFHRQVNQQCTAFR